MDRTVLPIPEPEYPPITELDARKVTPPPRFDVKAPAGAPDVLIVFIDDMGCGMSSAFGGPIHMPTVERLANEGLRYNQFHTTSLGSPTHTALLSGRNDHMNSMGAVTEAATAFPGNTGQLDNTLVFYIVGDNGTSAAGGARWQGDDPVRVRLRRRRPGHDLRERQEGGRGPDRTHTADDLLG